MRYQAQKLQSPHHDGSDLYVSNSAPTLGEKVKLRVRVPKSDKVLKVWVRLFHDGEPRTFELKKGRTGTYETWWSVEIEIINPVTHYRFLFVDKGTYRWLNGEGVFARDVVDREDFQIIAKPKYPDWIKHAVFYQIFPDRFAKSGERRDLPSWAVPREWNARPTGRGATTGTEFYGGDFPGVSEHLGHLEELGVNAIYFTPFFPSRTSHRYDASSFEHADPLLGGDQGFIEFSSVARKRGFRIMGDLTTNHCGIGHEWIQTALKNPDAKERDFFYWDKTIRHGYVGWWGVAGLPKLNYQSPLLREKMYAGADSVVKRWLKPPFNTDGWRIDVGNMTGRLGWQDMNQEVARGVRRAMDETNPNAWLVAENADHSPADLDGFGWHGTMNYVGFARPIWGWLSKSAKFADNFMGLPTPIPTFSGEAMVAMMRSFAAGIPWRSFTASMLLLDSHDTARFRNVVGRDRARHIAGATILFTYPGVPSIFAGDEIGVEGEWGEDARRTIDWEHPEKWDNELFVEFKKLIAIRKKSHALSNGGLRWIDISANSIAYLRESEKESVLVFVARSAGRYSINLKPYGYSIGETLYGPEAKSGQITISSKGAVSGIWRLK
ncbi:MAG TPA: glycoside hydrolase family 13 protein [Candidatus Paceibacterota bacterium]|nr:glycoside hydrolase family 13 protein [Candidatus Paceibacterota bacterium]